MEEILAVIAVILSVLTIGVVFFLSLQLLKNRERIDNGAKIIHEMTASIESLKVEFATTRALMFAYEAKLKGEQGCWCLEHEGNKKWYEPGVLIRTESSNGQNETEFSYDKRSGNVSAISRSKGKLVSSVTFSKSGTPIKGQVYTDGIASKDIDYDNLGQVIK